MPGYKWNDRRIQVVELVAGGWLTGLEIAAKVGIGDRQLRALEEHPGVPGRVEEYLAACRVRLIKVAGKDWLHPR